METTVLSPSVWSIRKNLQETLAQAEKLALEGKPTHTPPRQLLQYLVRIRANGKMIPPVAGIMILAVRVSVKRITEPVKNALKITRMGSFNSVPALQEDTQDSDFAIAPLTTRESLLARCVSELPDRPALISRSFEVVSSQNTNAIGEEPAPVIPGGPAVSTDSGVTTGSSVVLESPPSSTGATIASDESNMLPESSRTTLSSLSNLSLFSGSHATAFSDHGQSPSGSSRMSIRSVNLPGMEGATSTMMNLPSTSTNTSTIPQSGGRFRLLTWNILAQALAVDHDSFVGLPEGTLTWSFRRLRILHEIILYNPDVICLQEVDHFNFLNTCLSAIGYLGVFCSKPDSPCIYMPGNNGPDGCALFYRCEKFDLISASSRVLEIWRVQSNQVCIFANLRLKDTGQEICVATTHLKARQSALLATMRNEQGKDIANFVAKSGGCTKALVLCGDFNAEPSEDVITTVKSRLELNSAYAKLYNGQECPYTTWKIRSDGEYCHTLDYIFYNRYCEIESLLALPTEEQVGASRLPNLSYASDHIAIACDVKVKIEI